MGDLDRWFTGGWVAVERELSETPAPAPLTTADAIPPALRRRGGTPRQVLALTVVGILALALFASRVSCACHNWFLAISVLTESICVCSGSPPLLADFSAAFARSVR